MPYAKQPKKQILELGAMRLADCHKRVNASSDTKERRKLLRQIRNAYKTMATQPEYRPYLSREKYKHVLEYMNEHP